MSEARYQLDVIKEAIMEFRFSNFGGLDDLDELKEDPDTSEWVDQLAEAINKRLTTQKIIANIRKASQ